MNGLNSFLKLPKQYSMIGSSNNRNQNLRKLAKSRAVRIAEQHQKTQVSTKNQEGSTGSANTYCRNTRNPSISSKLSSNTNSRKGRSVAIGGNPIKPVQTANSVKGAGGTGGSQVKVFGVVTKKSFNCGNHNIDEGLKLPKVMPSISANFVSATNVERTISRESKN